MKKLAFIDSSPESYKRIGIKPDKIEKWEDGLRTNVESPQFEWWYFDGELEDGSKIAITFFTKPYTNVPHSVAPYIKFNLSNPDGTELAKILTFKPEEFKASKEHCDVHIGKNSFTGDLNTYNIHVEFEDFLYDIELKNALHAWRPETGFYTFGTDYLAWVVSVPQGTITARITQNGKQRTVQGHGYHDHNWGLVPMGELIHHWYWGRAQVGPYLVIASTIYGEKKFDSQFINTFLLAKGDKILADKGDNSQFTAQDIVTETETGKPVPNTLVFEYRDADQHYRLTFRRKRDIMHARFHDAKDGSYLRFAGDAMLQVMDENRVVDTYNQTAIWEEMYFGKVK